jgi:hypothetical protein
MAKRLYCLFVLGFLGMLASEGLLRVARWQPAADSLVAPSLPFPDLPRSKTAAFAFPAKVDEAFSSQLRLKRPAKMLNSAWPYFIFHSSFDTQVFVGRQGMLFDESYLQSMALPSISNIKPSDDGLEAWLDFYQARARVFAQAGIPYFIVIVPGKKSIYPEHLPGWLGPEALPARERFRQRAIAAGLHVVDLGPALLKAKAGGSLYLATDVHWNLRGAYAAYRQILSDWSRWHQSDPLVGAPPAAVPWNSLQLSEHTAAGGDLARTLGLQDLLPENETDLVLKDRPVPVGPIGFFNAAHALDLGNARGADLMLCGDSFAGSLSLLFSQNMDKVVPINGYLPLRTDTMAALRPRMFMDEFVEWRLLLPPTTKAP